ncbi:sigma-70 family RNA polymerase sigma factor [Streptomyces sp. NPDC005808]|uniref:sigma-70 family RNA polymerase sigma factor n=1 Tax=Streptomyces sp. NPDC005808 TaxID=3364734 RepID=UPI003692F208
MTATDTTTRHTPGAEESVEDIVDRARGGDREAFADLYVRYRPQIYTYLLRRTHDQQLSEDLTGDVFVRALDRIDSFTWRGSDFGAWLATTARNRLLDYYKSARYRRETPTADMRDHDQAADTDDQVIEKLARAPVYRELQKAITGLTRDQQECLRLRYWHDLPHAEIGRRMNRTQHAATILHQRALRSLSAPDIKAVLSVLSGAGATTSPPLPDQNTPGRTRRMATPAIPTVPAALTAGQAVALVLLRDGCSERSITQRTDVPGGTLYQLAAAHHISAPHGTVEGHRCHEAAGTEPCHECGLAAGRDQARALARHRKSLGSLPRVLRRQATARRKAAR